jgi:hypothetical protein
LLLLRTIVRAQLCRRPRPPCSPLWRTSSWGRHGIASLPFPPRTRRSRSRPGERVPFRRRLKRSDPRCPAAFAATATSGAFAWKPLPRSSRNKSPAASGLLGYGRRLYRSPHAIGARGTGRSAAAYLARVSAGSAQLSSALIRNFG